MANIHKIELWVDIKGYEGLYHVSTYGRVRKLVVSKDDLSVSFKIMKQMPCGAAREYRYVSLTKDHVTKAYLVHRIVAEAFNGLPTGKNPDGTLMRTSPEINHIDGCGANNLPENLEWCDRYYNNQHRRPSTEWNFKKRSKENNK